MAITYKKIRQGLVGVMLAVVTVSASAPTWAKTLTIGTISAVPVDELRVFQPFANYLAEALAEDGIDGAKVIIAPDIQQMAQMLKSGEIDLYIDSSVTALAINELSGSQYMLRRWKKGREQYRSVIFVRDDSSVKTLEDLKDKVIAFEEPFSTSGFMLPAMTLRRMGLDLKEVKSIASVPPSGTVGYVMAYDNETQAAWLERGRVQAVAMAEKDFKDFSETALTPLRVVYTTPYVPYHVMVHRPGLDAGLVTHIKTVLKLAHESEPGRAVLLDFERTAKFDDLPEALLADVLALKPFLPLIIEPH